MRRAKQERVKSNLSQSSYTHTNTPTHASTHAHRSPNTWHVRVQAIWQLHVALINSHVHTYRLCQIHTHTQVLPRTQNVRTHAHSTRYRHVCSAEHKNRCMNIHSMFTPMHTPSPKSPTCLWPVQPWASGHIRKLQQGPSQQTSQANAELGQVFGSCCLFTHYILCKHPLPAKRHPSCTRKG